MLDQAVTLSARGLRVLLIEDSPVLRGMVLEYLKASAFVATVEWLSLIHISEPTRPY